MNLKNQKSVYTALFSLWWDSFCMNTNEKTVVAMNVECFCYESLYMIWSLVIPDQEIDHF